MNDEIYKSKVEEELAKFDNCVNPLNEREIGLQILNLVQGNEGLAKETLAEQMAFNFEENCEESEDGWDLYYGPLYSISNKEGDKSEFPNIREIDNTILKYWERRSNDVKHPVLKARYSGLVWDFSQKIKEAKASHEVARMHIISILEIAENNLHKDPIYVIPKLKRAQSLALSLNSNDLLLRVNKTILDFEDKVANDDKAGLFGFSFDQLIENKNSGATDHQKEKVINDLENRLKRQIDSDQDPWSIEAVVIRLANYYRRQNRTIEVQRVVDLLGKAFERICKEASAIQSSSWLQRMHSIYLTYGMNQRAHAMSREIKKIGSDVNAGMKEISHEISIDSEKYNLCIEAMTEGNIDDVISRIVSQFVPKKEELKEQLYKMAQKTPLVFNIKKMIQDDKGRPIAEIGTLQSDVEGNVVSQMSQNMNFQAIFLCPMLERFIIRHSLNDEKITELIFRSPIFSAEKKEIICSGIRSYINKDYLVCLHLLIPQIEDAIRNLIEISGGTVFKPNRYLGFQLRNLDELLRDKKFVNCLNEDISLYFRVLYTDQRGWNIRNQICHGIMPREQFTANVAGRVIHSLFVLSLLREKDGSGEEKFSH